MESERSIQILFRDQLAAEKELAGEVVTHKYAGSDKERQSVGLPGPLIGD